MRYYQNDSSTYRNGQLDQVTKCDITRMIALLIEYGQWDQVTMCDITRMIALIEMDSWIR